MSEDPSTKPGGAATTPMIVCPTTHNDWDWQQSFECYYTTAFTNCGVRGILDCVTAIFGGTSSDDQKFCFSYAEVGFLRQYLEDPTVDPPSKIATLQAAGRRFCLLGGGITSPDNQVCDVEVFIRNYLTGHAFLRSVGLFDHVFPVGWIPDDFGHSPQLPVLLEAMGMKAAGLSRIPGSPQPSLCPSQQPADATVRKDGVTFHWLARDGSKVLTQFMPQTYYGLTNYSTTNTVSAMQQFLQQHGTDTWPGGVIFVTQGGDWQFPATDATVNCGTCTGGYNWESAIGATVTGGGVTAKSVLGTFADYFARLMPDKHQIPTNTLWAENYYTGYFASRPRLKIDHYHASRRLVGAEVIASLLDMYGGDSNSDGLRKAIADGWHLLVPTSHHDFVTGTSPDSIYLTGQSCSGSTSGWDSKGQLHMSARTVSLANRALDLGMEQLATRVHAPSAKGEVPVVVFNQLGRDLPRTAVVELLDPSGGATNYQVRVDGVLGPVQRSAEGTLLFQVPGMKSMAYRIVHLVPQGPGTRSPATTGITGDYNFSNGSVNLILSQTNAWAISSLEIDGTQYVQSGQNANALAIWQDDGNIYQFGMEYINQSGCGTGTFAPSGTTFTGNDGALLEDGPIRWRFVGKLTAGGQSYTTRYDLIAGETLVRIATTGAAPSGTSVLASFPMQDAHGRTGNVLEYGTAYHWENRDPQQSWSGLTFRASHDFAMLAGAAPGEGVAGVYHNGIPAWTIDGTTLRGCLLRNTPGGNRAASGSDTGVHTQHYTLDVGPAVKAASTGYPLRTALYAHTQLHARPLTNAVPVDGRMPERAQLASVAARDAIISVAKPELRDASADSRSIILRIQQATDRSQVLDVDLPFLRHRSLAAAEIVTALETAAERAPIVSVTGTTASFTADRALWTLRVATSESKK